MSSLIAAPQIALAVLVASICLITDLRWRRIPNVLTLPAVGIGLILGFVLGGWKGLVSSALGLGIGFGLMIIPYVVGGMGAGDVKLMAALGALIGHPAIFHVFLYTVLIGGVIALTNALWRGTLGRAIGNIFAWTKSLALKRAGGLRGGLSEAELAQTAGVIPYGVAIALGLYAYLAFGRII